MMCCNVAGLKRVEVPSDTCRPVSMLPESGGLGGLFSLWRRRWRDAHRRHRVRCRRRWLVGIQPLGYSASAAVLIRLGAAFHPGLSVIN